DERSRPENDRWHRSHARSRAEDVGRRDGRAVDFRSRNRRVDGGDVSDFPPRPAGRASDSRSRRSKRLGDYISQTQNSQAKGTAQIRRTLAPLAHHRKLVYVARRPPGRQRRPQNYQAGPKKEAPPVEQSRKESGRQSKEVPPQI